MHFIYVIMGKSASGKDTLFHALSENKELALKTIVPYTTRPIREAEEDGKEYHFVTNECRLELLKQGKVIEHRTYQTIHGEWNYFTVDDGQFDLNHWDYLLIGTLETYLNMQRYFQREHVRPIYLELSDEVRLERAFIREKQQKIPKYEEMCRRFLADNVDFSEEKLKEADIIVHYNSQDSNFCIQEVIRDIKSGTKI